MPGWCGEGQAFQNRGTDCRSCLGLSAVTWEEAALPTVDRSSNPDDWSAFAGRSLHGAFVAWRFRASSSVFVSALTTLRSEDGAPTWLLVCIVGPAWGAACTGLLLLLCRRKCCRWGSRDPEHKQLSGDLQTQRRWRPRDDKEARKALKAQTQKLDWL